jgi:hypothetical protein
MGHDQMQLLMFLQPHSTRKPYAVNDHPDNLGKARVGVKRAATVGVIAESGLLVW